MRQGWGGDQQGVANGRYDMKRKLVYIDGACQNYDYGSRAGYGVVGGQGDQRNEARALRGQEQTAQTAVVAALARALNTAGEQSKWCRTADTRLKEHKAS